MVEKVLKVLIVDDDACFRNCLKEYLELSSFNVLCAENGNQAEEIIAEQQPDYVLLDILMPEKDGIEMLMQLRQKNVRIITMSGEEKYVKIALKLGADFAFTKPFKLSELKDYLLNAESVA